MVFPNTIGEEERWNIRFVVDYRQVNALTKNFVYELPLISECLRNLSGFKLFSVFDCLNGYHQIPIKESDRDHFFHSSEIRFIPMDKNANGIQVRSSALERSNGQSIGLAQIHNSNLLYG